MRVPLLLAFIFALAAGPALAQTTTAPPSAPPSAPRERGPDMGGVAVTIDLGALFASGKGPCDKLREQLIALQTKKRDCDKEEAAVQAAMAALQAVKAGIETERARRDGLRAQARAASAAYQAAQANVAAAQAAASRAAQNLAAAQAALQTYLQNAFGAPSSWYSLTPPASGNWIGIEVEPGITVYFINDEGIWTPTRIQAAKDRLRQVMASSAAGTAARNAVRAALNAQTLAQMALAQAQAAANAAGAEYDAADAAVSGLPPVDLPLKPAERRLEAALKALEKCREEAARLARQIAETEEQLKDCDRLEILKVRLQAGEEAGERRIERTQVEVQGLEAELSKLEAQLAQPLPPNATPAQKAAHAKAKAAAAALRKAIQGLKADRDYWRGLVKDAKAGKNREGLPTEDIVEIAEGYGRSPDEYMRYIYDLWTQLRQAQADWDKAQADAQAAAQAASAAEQRWQAAQDSFEGLAQGMAEDTVKGMLGEADQSLGALFKALAAIDHVSEMSADQRAYLRALGWFLDGVLDAKGDERLCWPYGEYLALKTAQLGGSDELVGAAAMLHLGRQYCQAFMEAAKNPANRELMRKIRDAALAS